MAGDGVDEWTGGRAGHDPYPLGIYSEGEVRTHAAQIALRMADETGGDARNTQVGIYQWMWQHHKPQGEGVENRLVAKEGMQRASRSGFGRQNSQQDGSDIGKIKL